MADETQAQMEQAHPPTMGTMTLAIPPAGIALFKAIIESYDNLATVRTHDPVQHHLILYFAPENREAIDRLIDVLAVRFALVRLAFT